MKIALCIPHSYKTFNKTFILSLLSVVSSFHIYNGRTGMKHELNIYVQNEGYIDHMRNQLAKRAIAGGWDYLLWLDTDMTFPPNLIQTMIEDFEEYPELEAVTGLYTWKKAPFKPHVYTSYNWESGKFSTSAGFPTKVMFDVVAAGFGCVMIKKEVFERTPQPWFKMKIEGDNIIYGEDLYFFKKVPKIVMACDPRLSCGHLFEAVVDINSHIQYNKLKVDEKSGDIVVTDEQIKEMGEEHSKMLGKE